MEQTGNKKKIMIEKSERPSSPDKKVVRRIVKVIDSKELNVENLQREIKEQNDSIRERKEAEERRKKESERLEEERRKEELRKKAEEEERERRKQEERKRLLEEIRKREAKQKVAEQKAIDAEKKEAKKKEKAKKREERKNKTEDDRRKEKEYIKNSSLKNKIWRAVKAAFISLFITGMCGACALSLILYSWCQDIPEIDVSELGKSAQTSFIYDINGDLITTYSGSENREWVSLEDMPQKLIDAFVCVEDKRFFEHGAIDPKRFIKAILGQVIGNDNAGGSTITQQLVKNVYLTNEVTYKRKMQEILLSYQLEKKMDKNSILEAYLNIIYFGSSNYGVAAAARDYFGKSLDELSVREIAMLAGIPKNPNGYNPRRNTYIKEDMTSTDKRTDNVLWVMHNEGVISDFEYEMALKEEVHIQEKSSFFEMYDNAHAVEYAMKQVIEDMLEERGMDNTYENRSKIDAELRSGGYTIHTTIDPEVQSSLQDTLEGWDRYPNVLDSKGNPIRDNEGEYEKPQTAAVIIQPGTGYVLAMCGSRETPTSMKTLNRSVSSTMPVASTIKPLSIYAPCIESGLYPGSVEYNFKTYIEGYDNKAAYPGGNSPESVVTMRDAVKHSYNISAARFLVNNVGYELSEDYLIALGIDKGHIQKNGSGLALGTSGINMLELTAAYQTLAGGGIYYEPKAYVKVTDSKGNIVLDSREHQETRRVFSENTAWLMSDILASVTESGNSTQAKIKGVQTAGKSGTHENKCSLFAGYTGEYVSCLWIGSDSFSNLSDSSGSRQAAPLWNAYMADIYNKKGITKKYIYEKIPQEIQKMSICADSGLLAGEDCPNTFMEYASDDLPTCNMHISATFCNYSGLLAGDDCDADATKEKKVMVIPADSSMASLPEEIIKENWKNAIVIVPENICSTHVNGNAVPTDTQIGYSRNLVRKIQGLLANTSLEQQYTDQLNADLASINNMISRAENALINGTAEGNNFYSEYFAEYNRVKTDINNIQSVLDSMAAQSQQNDEDDEE